jgi:hypothetical protein
MQDGTWGGHTEALFPTIASYNHLVIEDIGGTDPFTQPLMRGMNSSIL